MVKQIKLKGKDIFDGQQLRGADQVLILTEDGMVTDLVPAALAGDDVREVEGILCPGFINTHCHLELSHMRGVVPEQTGLPVFLQTVMEKRNTNTADQETAMAAAADQMWASGIVAVGDICNTPASLSQKQDNRFYYHSFIECMGFVEAGAASRFDFSRGVLEQFKTLDGPYHRCSIVPHAPYSVSKKLFDLLAGVPDNDPVSVHNQETAAENELYERRQGDFLAFYQHFGMDISAFQATGTSSLQSWLPHFRQQQVIMVHNTFTTETDIRFAMQQPVSLYWCLCPGANLYIENRLPDIDLFIKCGAALTIGTDSLASNHTLSVWEEIKTIRRHYPQLPLETLLQWGTANGAGALDIDDRYGYFRKGYRPGVVLLQEDSRRLL